MARKFPALPQVPLTFFLQPGESKCSACLDGVCKYVCVCSCVRLGVSVWEQGGRQYLQEWA